MISASPRHLCIQATFASALMLTAAFPVSASTLYIPTSNHPDDAATSCFEVKTIKIDGFQDVAKENQIEGIVKPIALACQDNESVSAILKAVNGFLSERGYVTTQAWLPEQNIAESRELLVQIVPGRIDRVEYVEVRADQQGRLSKLFRGKTARAERIKSPETVLGRISAWFESLDDDLDNFTILGPNVRIAVAKTVKPGDILTMDEVQNTVDSLNRVPSNKAKAELKPGEKPATSTVVIQNTIKDTFRLYAGYDTENVQGFDQLRFGLTLEKDNLLGVNETWRATAKTGLYSNELSGAFAIPIGNLNFRLNGTWSDSLVNLSDLAEFYSTTRTFSAGGDWTLSAAKDHKLIADFDLQRRELLRYINGTPLTPQVLAQIRLGLSYSQYFGNSSISGRAGGSFGLNAFGANEDFSDPTGTVPRAQFSKFEGSLSAEHVIPNIASLNSVLSGQFTNDVLYSDDQLTLGSRSSVRGYSGGNSKVDSGAIWRNEVGFALSSFPLPSKEDHPVWLRDLTSRTNLYVFGDLGAGYDNANKRTPYRISAGAGVRYAASRLSFDVGYGFRLAEDRTASIVMSPDRGELFFNLRFKAL
ncbi:ShlB/FhaC/HecB family hemolysin secretion/activation protein [Agrobacterium sp. Azo12]|uniref:ShlB/FhaC/HecB family hemolysin secretion/activation protein n=1 Tax=Agrobacterium sp. Azo12 TaxID=3031129 RepID=UPI0023D8504E|nr:ShlB/FhaC/HecB family hemolysin secretion/activation protein [Agrobacterium sp. Azo12]MDO5897880.1 ShlB/FhaC/HecB family hemolysin secretion/activation protein [Agrobacterium sp. Azo12]